jgi:hypothetical protein
MTPEEQIAQLADNKRSEDSKAAQNELMAQFKE